ncbi:DUF1064 domain-containing protein [Paenibacillus xylanexedens]|uniref:DUF1064 domain-containing protein n=1 Tax=Paenibacillus xylanexedens TaxID=528191 RepID=UPI0011A0619D|nr:DUF1064 domain-containing protein [Paenibacillus xylanexedens]
MSKYNAKKVIVTEDGTLFTEWVIEKYNLDVKGIWFDSMSEGEYYQLLLQQKKYGDIKDFECHPRFVLQEKPKVTYIADFLVTELNGSRRVVDIKGVETSTFRVKLKLFQAKYPTLPIDILVKKCGEFIPLAQYKKEKSARKRAANSLKKRADEGRKQNANQIYRNQK